MFIKKFIFFFLFILIYACDGINFVYENYEVDNFLKEKTAIFVSGDEKIILKTELKNRLKNVVNKRSYELQAVSKKTLKNLVVENNQQATQVEISHKIQYYLKDTNNDCIINSKEIITKIDYTIKSEGYNFGSASSKKEMTKNNIIKNITKYIEYAKNNLQYKACKQ